MKPFFVNNDDTIKHLILSVCVFGALFGLVRFSYSLIADILANPQAYFDVPMSVAEVNLFLIYTSMVVVSVLVSYILYLLLLAGSRAKAVAVVRTRYLSTTLEQLTDIYEGAPVPYLILNDEGNILIPNKAALRFFGVVQEEIQDKNLFYFQPEEDKEKADKFLSYYKARVTLNREEVRMKTKNGQVKWALLSVFKIKDPTGQGRTGLAVLFDITEEKELDRAKTEFVSLASHQLGTPIATVKWYIDVLLSPDLGELTPKQKEYLERIYKVNQNMIELVDTLLNVSRIEIGSIAMEKKSTNVPEIIESIFLELSSQIESKRIQIQKEYNGNLDNINSDPKLLRIIAQNLLSNAIKYTPEGGAVSVVLKQSWNERAIIVSDTGIGIPATQQDKIFNKLFRARNTRTLKGDRGTGLGLYLVKSLVETLGGKISFVSEENKGTTFTVKF